MQMFWRAGQRTSESFGDSGEERHDPSHSAMSGREQAPASTCGAPLKQTSRDVFKYIMTQDRIPEFVIPSLDILKEHRLFSKEKGPSWSSALGSREHEDPKNGSDPSPKNNSVQPSHLPCCSGTEMDAKLDDIPDPVTWAAFSLPHLPKITTPYGFMALGESPHVTKEESLFFQLDLACLEDSSKKRYSDPQAGHQHCGDCEGTRMACLKDRHPVQKVNRPALPQRSSGSVLSSSEFNLSKAAAGEDDGLPKPLASLMTICRRSSSSPEFPLQRPKRNLFKKILKKHFAHLRSLKVATFPGH